MIREALFYDRLDNRAVRCRLCPIGCRLTPDRRGVCRCRFNDDGRLMTDNFGETVTFAVDPIEKKPLYHFHPGSIIASIGANGCNLSCQNCQNWEISQKTVPTSQIEPEQLPRLAAHNGSIGIAYTYTEPTIWYEFILEAAPLVKAAGLVNVMVTNGYINPEPLDRLLPFIDAFNVDLKAMKPEFYHHVCKGKLEPVLDAIQMIAASPAHLELTNLVIPGLNDSDEDFDLLAEFVASVDQTIPVHLSAYHPSYKMRIASTPVESLSRGFAILRKLLHHVYIGNMDIAGCSDSHCPACGAELITRAGYSIRLKGIDDSGRCLACGAATGIIMGR
jgi:pyruvate formate lyase activating enzyme